MSAAILAQILSKVLLMAGALTFLVADRVLRVFFHLDFVPAEGIGIGGGLLLMALGWLLQSASTSEVNRLKGAGDAAPHHVGRDSQTS